MADMVKPLRLKDLLELDCDSCSAAGFRCYPRRLGESSPPMPLSFCRSPSSLRRRSSKLSHISRSLSRRLRGGFWWRRRDDDEEVDAAVPGGGCPSEPDTSPSGSSGSSGSKTRRSPSESDSEFSSASSSSGSESMHDAVVTAEEKHEGGRRKKAGEGSSSGSEAGDKEQLSPVAVMDFPCFDGEDDAGLGSPSLDDSMISRVQRGRTAQKIRRFGSLDELVPMDLEAHLAASPDHDDVPAARQLPRHADETTPPNPTRSRNGASVDVHDEPGLLARLMDTVPANRTNDVTQRLLLDYFVEMKVERRSQPHSAPQRKAAERLGDDDGEILAAARRWLLDGAGAERWGLEDVLRGGEAVLAEMERGRRWMQVGEEEREVGTVVGRLLIDQMVDEMVRDLLV